jgi:hypothetical protein
MDFAEALRKVKTTISPERPVVSEPSTRWKPTKVAMSWREVASP